MGKSQRFQTRAANMPGPANYKISGFADDVLKKASKKRIKVEENQFDDEESKGNSTDKRSSKTSVIMDLLDNDHSNNEEGGLRFDHRPHSMDEDDEDL
jgi:hypothetical protein